ncbi:DUF5344 family protein [Fictibacillus sp. Mic-4]|uniref:DUF5344 family protein n=1 Tax=Fictibacillus sp. Mic-4 TaxID=3132826 RepID=UPI003CF518D7
MPEIKINEQEIKSALDTLKAKTNDLHSAASKPVFRHSSLQFLKFLQEVEELMIRLFTIIKRGY